MDYTNVRHRIEEEVFPQRECALVRGFATKNYNISMHDHSFYEINLILEGHGTHFLEGEKFEASVGDVFVIPPGTAHGYESTDKSFNVYHIILKDAFLEKYSAELKSLSGYSLLFEIEPYLRTKARKFYINLDFSELETLKPALAALCENLNDESRSADITTTVKALGIICDLSKIMYERSLAPKTETGKEFSQISKSLEYIHECYSERISLDTLAKLSNMSRSTFVRKFKSICHTTPNEYLINYRCAMAKKLLTYGVNKTTVAHQCGFYDISHMEKSISKGLPV